MGSVLKVAILLVVLLTGAAGAAAQTPTAPASKVEVTAGYQFQRLGGDDGLNMPKGGFAEIAFGTTSLQGVVQLGASFKSESSTFISGGTTFASEGTFSVMRAVAGVRSRTRGTGVTGFGHVLAGLVRLGASSTSTTTGPSGTTTREFDDGESKFAAQIGAGLNIPTSERTHVRLGADYQRVFVEGGGNIYLASVGFGFRLGR